MCVWAVNPLAERAAAVAAASLEDDGNNNIYAFMLQIKIQSFFMRARKHNWIASCVCVAAIVSASVSVCVICLVAFLIVNEPACLTAPLRLPSATFCQAFVFSFRRISCQSTKEWRRKPGKGTLDKKKRMKIWSRAGLAWPGRCHLAHCVPHCCKFGFYGRIKMATPEITNVHIMSIQVQISGCHVAHFE